MSTPSTLESNIPHARKVCDNHPERETGLSCNRCGMLICANCARKTPVGYRCKKCVRQQQSKFDTARWYDYLVAIGVSLVLSGITGVLVARMGWLVVFLAPAVGGAISEIIRRAVGRRRGRYLSYAAVAGMIGASLFNLTVWGLIYLVLAASTVYSRLRSISI